MKRHYSIYITFFLILSGIIVFSFPTQLLAQETSLDLLSGDILVVEGEDFTYEKVENVVNGVAIVQERAIWEGGVSARFGEITLETQHIEVIFEGSEVASLVAGPQVVVRGFNGKARFECADVEIMFPPTHDESGAYTGICNDVRGYYLMGATELGLEGDQQYEVNFTAKVARLTPDEAILEYPCLSLGNLDDPDLSVQSREINFRIGDHPLTGERTVLGARSANLSFSLFGTRLNLLPFPVWRGFIDTREPGLRIHFPNIGWEGDEYLRIDQSFIYDFNDETVKNGPRVILRLDTFPFARTYPELLADVEFDGLIMSARAGYRREEDSEGDTIPTRAEPELSLGTVRVPLDENGLGFSTTAFWGHLRDMQTGLDLDRWGYRAILDHPGVPMGEFNLSGMFLLDDSYYEGGDNYCTVEGRIRFRYIDAPRWGASLTYRQVYEWGSTPFRFDEPQVRKELGLREMSRFNQQWGAGFDWAWDFDDDEFARQECFINRIFDSFQVSFGWDFANESAKIEFALPGSLK